MASNGMARASNTIAIIVQARMGSTRLPGKVLAPVLGRPLLEYQLERLGRSTLASSILVATTVGSRDDAIVGLCRRLGVAAFRGDETDVLRRYMQAATLADADVVVRSTADCPLIDPSVVDEVIGRLLASKCDYASNTLTRTFPRGLDVEAMTRTALEAAHRDAVDPADREHVTRFLYRHPERFRLCSVERAQDLSSERWTVDTREDLELVRRILETLYPGQPSFGINEVVALLDRHPDWRGLNAEVAQRRD